MLNIFNFCYQKGDSKIGLYMSGQSFSRASVVTFCLSYEGFQQPSQLASSILMISTAMFASWPSTKHLICGKHFVMPGTIAVASEAWR